MLIARYPRTEEKRNIYPRSRVMTELEMQRLAFKGMLADLPESDRVIIESTAKQLKEIISAAGENGELAMALVGSEIAAKQE